MRSLAPLLGGVLVSVGLWLYDLLRLSSYRFAGVTDAEAAERVLAVTRGAVLRLEVELLLVHVAFGLGLSGLSMLFWMGRAQKPHLLVRTAAAAGFTLLCATLALFGMVGTYPQIFADRWWLAGGVMAGLQRIVTHGVGPRVFDGALAILLIAVLVRPGVRLLRLVSDKRWKLARRYAAVSTVLLFLLLALRLGLSARATGVPDRLNLLIVASDSLRSDRIEDPEVMPFTASTLSRGTLFRYAVTPIARTYPAWVSTLTGTEPRENGVRHMFPTVGNRRDVGATLFTELRDRGYFTFVASDFAGDIFPGFEGGFEHLDTPHLTADTLARSTVLASHSWSLPLLRLAVFRRLFPTWRNVPSLADPQWVVDNAIDRMDRAGERPFAGLIFFSTAHFPYAGPHPDYRRGSEGYRGRYLYHVPPVQPDEAPDGEDIRQIRARYDGALEAVDRATERLVAHLDSSGLGENTIVVITGDHGEELYEEDGIAGHGDTLRYLRSQAVPIFMMGPGVPRRVRSSTQVRHYDLPATVLDLFAGRKTFGHGTSLFVEDVERPVCVETGLWFWPGRPLGLRGERLDYPGISELLELEPETREMVLREEMETLVESAKERGVVVGRRLYRERLTPNGFERETLELVGPNPAGEETDLGRLFDQRCVDADPRLSRLHGAVVFEASR